AAIGALAVAPSDHKTIWAGTGEAWAIRDSDMMGDGIYKSTDSGATWTHMGLDETGRIGRIIVHPTNPDIVFACALGRLTGPQQERGVYRTMNGGKTWDRVLFADPNTGCSGLAMDAHNPRVLFAGMWQVEMHTYGMFSGGPSSAVYVSRDGGTKWTRIEGRGLPKPPIGKIDVAIAPTNLSRVYALIQTADQGSLWRSDDGGENWTVASWARALIGRAGYYIRLAVSPANENEVLVANSSFHLSTDGGKTFRTVPWGGDTHDIWIDPLNANRILVTHDGGMYMTSDHGRTSTRVSLPIGQMYHVAVDNDVPYKIYGNMQDDGTMRGPSNSPEVSTFTGGGGFGGGGGGGAPAGNPPAPANPPAGGGPANPPASSTAPAGPPGGGGEGGGGGSGFGGGRGGPSTWDHGLGGCESGFTLPDPTDPNVIWATCYGNEVTRYDYSTKLARSVSPWLHTLDSEPDKAKYRCHWTPPMAIDPFDHNTVYYGCQVIFRTSNGGTSWSVISPDLSTQDPSRNVSSGGIVGDNLGQFYGEVVFAIAPSEIQKGLIWAGTNDGKVWYTKDAGAHWNDVTKNIPGVPPLGVISRIEPSHFDAGTAYIAVDLHLADNRDPFLYKTTDFGQTWTKITGNLPKGTLAYARVIAENPNRKGMLFAGTGNALYYSTDDGGNWKQLKDGLPAAPVSWIVVEKNYHDLVVSTYGRGFYILEDLTPLEDTTPASTEASVRFYAPRAAYRLLRNGRALLNYSLKAPAKEAVKVEILDAKGAVVREIPANTGQSGINRIGWDLRYDAPRLVALRTTPPENPHIWEEPRFVNATTRPVLHWGIQQAEVGPIAAPGKYTARLTVDGQTYTQALEILRPPSSHGSDTDLQSSVRLQVKVRDDINSVSDMVNQIEWMRKQVEDTGKSVAGQSAKQALLKSMDALDRKMQEVEYKLITREDALSDDKYFTTQYKLYLQLIWLNGEIGTGGGDVAGSADYGPTETAIGLVFGLEKELEAVRAEYRNLMDKEIPVYNNSLAGSGVNPVLTTPPPPAAPAGRGNRGGQN
ncbi:MAG TPA: sialidase, partial [Bryobacteraceae bacterium]|nr:sialidase [Bryobacteraceae bacterium]